MNTLSQPHTIPKTGAAPGRTPCLKSMRVLLCLAALLFPGAGSNAQIVLPGPTVGVSGSITLPNNTTLPNFFSWGQRIGISGSGWSPSETLSVHMVGPLNQPGVASSDLLLGTVVTDGSGNMTPGPNTRVKIPSIHRVSTQPNTPRPGHYQLYAAGKPAPNGVIRSAYAFNGINLSPTTIPKPALFPDFILWAKERGGRPGQLGDISPERIDPEWMSVWDERPVAFYATVAETDHGPTNQPAFITHSDYPSTHYAHDVNLLLVPDQDYRWLLGDANFADAAESAGIGRIEWEWETQNNGRPFVGSYGTGNIGFPLWAMPTAGDRVYTVGRWAMDNGHPDSGDRTEIHPPRLLATMRKRNTAIPFFANGADPMTRASQVDIYVSGHGGGANMFPDGLSAALNDGGLGGGSIYNVLFGVPLDTYSALGPADGVLASLVTSLLGGNSDLIKSLAGPSGLGWLNGPEERPINDMDYDFDVPLPALPPGPHPLFLQARVQVTTHPEDTTRVQEVITYTNVDSVTGFPTTAHIHLPYNGADTRIYARTLKFNWSQFNPPGKHYIVQMNRIDFFLAQWMSGRTYMWTDVCGQWVFLTGLNPNGFLNAGTVLGVNGLGAATFDVYLDPTDTLRVFTQGYDQEEYDYLFGVDVGKTQYDAGLDIVKATIAAKLRTLNVDPLSPGFGTSASSGDNVDLGGALFDGIVNTSTGFFYQDFTVTYVPTPPSIGAVGVPVDFGSVALGATGVQDIQIFNDGETNLVISGITVSGGGFSATPELPLPTFVIPGGIQRDVLHVSAQFKPTAINQGAGFLTIQSNDPLRPSFSFPLRGTVLYPTIKATAGTARTPTLVVGSSTTWPVTITNTGTSSLRVKPSIAGAGFSISLPASYYVKDKIGNIISVNDIVVAPGASSLDLIVGFTCPSVLTKFVGTLTLASNDPVHPITTLVFGAEGVPVGMRVLVVGADGTPYPIVDDIQLKRDGKPKTKVHLKDVPLTTVDPPASWKRIQYHYQTALAPTGTGEGADNAVGDDGNSYELRVKVGKKTQTLTFTLGASEFKQIVITLP